GLLVPVGGQPAVRCCQHLPLVLNIELCSVAPQGVRTKVPLSISHVKLKIVHLQVQGSSQSPLTKPTHMMAASNQING
ncbi:MAG: hypothetical protein AAGG02_20745, partial [Cyanobacteria bacterium P01_H01_bin.15]